LTAPSKDLATFINCLDKAPFKIHFEEKEIEEVKNFKEMIKKLKAKESELLDKMKLFNQPLKLSIYSLFSQSVVSLLVKEE
jgi:hypothetical protein